MKRLFLILCFSHYLQAQQSNTILLRKDSSVSHAVVNESPAEYTGGVQEMIRFINANINFPEKVKKDSTFSACKVYVKFDIDTAGYVQNAQIVKGCKGFDACDLEALRVVRLMPRWHPAVSNGKKVKSVYSVPINFKIR